MAFNDDLRGLSRAEQIARVQAVAREHGDALTEDESAQALGLYATATIYASRERRRMLPLTVEAADAHTHVSALEAHGFTVQLGDDGASREAGS